MVFAFMISYRSYVIDELNNVRKGWVEFLKMVVPTTWNRPFTEMLAYTKRRRVRPFTTRFMPYARRSIDP